jgi:copper resistance protein C
MTVIRLRRALSVGWVVLWLLLAPPLWAHADQEGSVPEHGATVEGTPERIGIWFDHKMRITLFEVAGANGRVDLRARPTGQLVERFETAPAGAMAAGEYTVRWRGLAEDGHAMFDEFQFTVR